MTSMIPVITLSALVAVGMTRNRPTEHGDTYGYSADIIDFASAKKAILAKRSLSQRK